MRKEQDFSKARRGPVLPVPTGKTRITIRLDGEPWARVARVACAALRGTLPDSTCLERPG